MKKLIGFTLVELMVAVVIVMILSTIASKMYSNHVRKGRRIDGINALLNLSLAEERYRSNNATYGTLAQVWGAVSTSPDGYYTIAVTSNTAAGYTATATASGNQANDAVNATSCTTLTLAVSNGTITKTPAVCWPN